MNGWRRLFVLVSVLWLIPVVTVTVINFPTELHVRNTVALKSLRPGQALQQPPNEHALLETELEKLPSDQRGAVLFGLAAWAIP
jgi:hypothetical protein